MNEINHAAMGEEYLAHHGILGQKWGVQNGPPYPLDDSDHSSSEKKAGWRKSLKEISDYAKAKSAENRVKAAARKEAKAEKDEANRKKKVEKIIKKGDIDAAKKFEKKMTNEEIAAVIYRYNQMQALNVLNDKSSQQKGKDYMSQPVKNQNNNQSKNDNNQNKNNNNNQGNGKKKFSEMSTKEKTDKVLTIAKNTSNAMQTASNLIINGVVLYNNIAGLTNSIDQYRGGSGDKMKKLNFNNKFSDDKSAKHSAIDLGEDYLAHHGIEGQKWGVRNGPPYPIETGMKKGTRLSTVKGTNMPVDIRKKNRHR